MNAMVGRVKPCCRLQEYQWLAKLIIVILALGSSVSLTFDSRRKTQRTTTTTSLFFSLKAIDNDETRRVDNRPHEQRTTGRRPARRLNHALKHLYRHDFHLTVTDPVDYLMQEGGYTETQVYDMNRTFPPLLTLSIQRQLHPKMRFLKETLGASPDMVRVPPQYFGARLERTLAPRHAFLVFAGLPHGRVLFDETITTGPDNTTSDTATRWHYFLVACRTTKRFAALCQSWQRSQGEAASSFVITPKRIEAFDALFGRGILAAARNDLVQSNNTWSLDTINITSSQLIRLLIQHGANVHERDYRGVPLLHWAAGTGNTDALHEILPHLSETVWIVTERDHATPLHWAVAGASAREFGTGGHVEVCRALLAYVHPESAKDYVNQQTLDGNSPLMWAAWSGSLETVKLLVRNRADATIVNRNGCSVAHWAASGGNEQVCRYLFNAAGVDFTISNDGGHTPLTHAVAFGRAAVVEWLRKEVVNDEDDAAYSLAQDFVHWDASDKRRKKVLELFEEWDAP
jgi:ankyrin repeat protein